MNLKILSAVLIALGTTTLATAASAANCDTGAGFYVGGQAGYGKADYGNANGSGSVPGFLTITSSGQDDGIAGRAYAGYQFNQYFGAETGYTYFSDNTYKISVSSPYVGTGNANFKITTQQIDLLGKIGTPFGNSGFRGDVKAGVAYIFSNVNISGTGTQDNWDPAAGASLSYNFNQNFAMDVSYLHAFGSGNLNSPNTDLVTLGVSYRFA